MTVEFNRMHDELDDQTEGIGDIDADNDPFGSTAVIPNDAMTGATADDRVQVGSVLRDRFLLKERAAGGSMGIVFKALDRRLAEAAEEDHWVAIKVLAPQLAENAHALRALQQEAAKGRCLAHPNIVRFLDLDREDDLYFLVMEWLDGRTLAEVLDSEAAKSIDQATALKIVWQIGSALSYAHRCGIVHADVKPANVMLMPNGDAKLFDFGIARVRQKQVGDEFNPSGLKAMTPAYSSMQVLTGEEPAPSDDVFSLACLLYRLLAGHRVFGPRNAAEASEHGMNPARPNGISDDLWRALKKALSHSRVMRFASVDEFLAALRDAGNAALAEPFVENAPVKIAPVENARAKNEPVENVREAAFDNVRPDPLDNDEIAGGGSIGKWIIGLVLLLGIAAGMLYQQGTLDPWLEEFGARWQAAPVSEPVEVAAPVDNGTAPIEFKAPEPTPDTSTLIDGTAEIDAADKTDEPDRAAAAENAVAEPLIDFSSLPPADLEVSFSPGGASIGSFNVTLREGDAPVIIDFLRRGSLAAPLTLKLEEVGFSGNRSPWGSQQYSFSDNGIVRFPAGQARARISLVMSSDRQREADQLSTLRLREADSPGSELAVIYVSLEDDDQRAFEAGLPANTIGFAAAEVTISEADPAVQIELVRFNPDEQRIVTEFAIIDVTASEGADYFWPASSTVVFGPGQRSARLLIPLVQDSLVEGDETFVIELATPGALEAGDVYRRALVLIRDDEPQYR